MTAWARRSVTADYTNTRGDRVGLLLMATLWTLPVYDGYGLDVAVAFWTLVIAIWPVVNGYVHEVVR